MNTDNTSLAGETLDYGPCAFLDTYDPLAVFSSIDRGGRYAFSRQPALMHWNLARLAEALLPLLDTDANRATELAYAALDTFTPTYETAWRTRFGAKLGISNPSPEDDALIRDFLTLLHHTQTDFTQGFLALPAEWQGLPHPVLAHWATDPAGAGWLTRWRARLSADTDPLARMTAHNPRIIPRNGWVEQAVRAATDQLDFAPFHALLAAATDPFQKNSAHDRFEDPPSDQGRTPFVTFCGT
jgi:uncharacterized protein YdiU (UPF0061 family)